MNEQEQNGKSQVHHIDTAPGATNRQALQTWLTQVLDGPDARDRVAVTGQRISHGAFGKIMVEASAADSGAASPMPGSADKPASNDAVFDVFTQLAANDRASSKHR